MGEIIFDSKTGALLGGVLKPVAAHHNLTVEEPLEKLKLN